MGRARGGGGVSRRLCGEDVLLLSPEEVGGAVVPQVLRPGAGEVPIPLGGVLAVAARDDLLVLHLEEPLVTQQVLEPDPYLQLHPCPPVYLSPSSPPLSCLLPMSLRAHMIELQNSDCLISMIAQQPDPHHRLLLFPCGPRQSCCGPLYVGLPSEHPGEENLGGHRPSPCVMHCHIHPYQTCRSQCEAPLWSSHLPPPRSALMLPRMVTPLERERTIRKDVARGGIQSNLPHH